MLRTMPAGLDAFLDQIAKNTRISVHNKAGIVYSLPYSYLQKVRAVPGVVERDELDLVRRRVRGGEGRHLPELRGRTRRRSAIVYEDYGIDPQALADFQRYRDAAIVGRRRWRSTAGRSATWSR